MCCDPKVQSKAEDDWSHCEAAVQKAEILGMLGTAVATSGPDDAAVASVVKVGWLAAIVEAVQHVRESCGNCAHAEAGVTPSCTVWLAAGRTTVVA